MFHPIRLSILALLGGLLLAQDFRATITGRVTDPSGASVPGAQVTVTKVETNSATSTQADERGDYTVPLLGPGLYEIRASAPGFKQSIRENVPLRVGQTATVDIVLELGAVTEEVTVSAEMPLLEAANASRGAVIDNKQVSTIPLVGRNPFMLATVSAGVNYAGRDRDVRPFDNNFATKFSMNGSPNSSSEFLLDGAPNNARAGFNGIALVPSVDAVHEFRIQTNSYDAQYGKTGGGIVNVSLKSGTNGFHGTVYEFARRPSWDANSFQDNARGSPRPNHKQDQYGAVVSGPIYIPNVYDGRNKSFFMFSLEDFNETVPRAHNLSVPTEAMRTGDFSSLVDGQGQLIAIYDPASGQQVGDDWVRAPFKGNVIPASLVNPIARNILSYMPPPNTETPGVEHAQQNLFIPGDEGAETEDFYQIAAKYDQNIGNNHRFFFRHANNDRVYGGAYNGIFRAPGTEGWYPHVRWNTSEVLDWISTPSPTFVFNARVSFSRFKEINEAEPNNGFDITTLGFPQSVADQIPNEQTFGLYRLSGYIGMGRTPSNDYTNTWAIHPSVTKIQSAHTIKAGLDMRWIHYNQRVTGNNFLLRGGPQFTQRDFALRDALSGNSVASWLLGAPTGGQADDRVRPAFLYKYYAPWLQDDWKVNDRLTINLGLRWDLNVPANERFDRLNRGFDANQVNSVDALIDRETFPGTPQLLGGLQFVAVSGNSRTAADLYKKAIQPRVGFAYRITDRLVARGGWGRYFHNPSNDFLQTAGFSESTPLVSSLNGGRTPVPGLMENPFPNGVQQPAGTSLGDQTFLGRGFGFVNTDFNTPHVNQFSFGFQYQVSGSSRFEISYVGSRTTNLQTDRPFNEFGLEFRQLCNVLEGGDPNFCNERVPNPFQGLDPFLGTGHFVSETLSRADLARPYPHFGSLDELTRNDGSIWYNSLQTSYEVRMQEFSLLGSYTFSKMIEEIGFNDVQRNILQRGLFMWDRPHRFTLVAIYELPFGKNNASPWSRVVGGWQTAINFVWQSGRPWDLPGNVLYMKDARIDDVDWSAPQILGVRPCVARMDNDGSVAMQPFSVSAGCTEPNFIITPQYAPRLTPNQEGRIRLHTVPNANISLIKSTRVTETTRIEFRAEAFNAFNTYSLYDAPFNNNPNSANFGTITKATVGQGATAAPRSLQLAVKFIW